MANLKPEFGRQLAALMRDYLRLQADARSLASILTYVDTQHELPVGGWLATLKAMRETPEYRKIAEQYEPQFRAVEDAADVEECQQLLATMPPTQYPN